MVPRKSNLVQIVNTLILSALSAISTLSVVKPDDCEGPLESSSLGYVGNLGLSKNKFSYEALDL